jgi:DNA-directed RNA polymerase specialized sigma24 family protein
MPNLTHRLKGLQILPADLATVAALSKQHATVLSAFETHKSYEAMAAEMGLPVGTVKSRLHRARAKLIAKRPQETAGA